MISVSANSYVNNTSSSAVSNVFFKILLNSIPNNNRFLPLTSISEIVVSNILNIMYSSVGTKSIQVDPL